MAHLLVLLRSATRIAMAEAALADLLLQPAGIAADTRLKAAEAIVALERACRALASLLSRGCGAVPLDACREKVRALLSATDAITVEGAAALTPFALALRHLEAAEDAAVALFGAAHRMPGLLPPLEPAPPLRARLAILRAHLTLSSLILRHALRVALSAGTATAIMVWFAVPHGIWLPLTALVVPQPEFGGTLRRAFERSVGTIGGAMLTAVLLYFLRGTVAFEILIVVLGFGAFLLLRRKYAFAIVFLTVVIMLLLGLADPNPWIDIRDRILDTVSGAVVAIFTAYLLWPQWEHERLTSRLCEALQANRSYLDATLSLLAGTAMVDEVLAPRRLAEVATGNAEAAFQRMLAEPRGRRRNIGQAFPLITHLRRLNQHITALVARLETDPARSAQAKALSGALALGIESAAGALAANTKVAAFEPPEAILVALRSDLTRQATVQDNIGPVIGRIVSDIGALHFAAANK